MPHVVNGIGTWYYGRSNLHRTKGVCSICHKQAILESYDVGHFFVFLFIPILPLGKKRVLEHCKTCDYHYSLPLKKWLAQRDADTAECMAKLQDHPNDPEAIRAALELAMRYQDAPLFEKMAQTLVHGGPDNAQLQLTLGMGYDYFGQPEPALAAYQKSLALEDQPKTRELIILGLLAKQEPEEAAAMAKPLLETLSPEQAWLPMALVSGFQEQGQHVAALAIIQQTENVLPDLTKNKNWNSLKKQSLKHQGTSKRLKSSWSGDPRLALTETGNGSKIKAALFVVGLLGLLAFYLIVCYRYGQHRQVILANGLDQAYTVEFQGQSVELPARGVQTVKVAEGRIAFRGSHPKLQQELLELDIETTFLTRPFNNPIFVVNLDALAILEFQSAIYAVNPPPMPPPDYLLGQQSYFFESIDFLFCPMPEKVELKNRQSITKTQLNLMTGQSPKQRIRNLREVESIDKQLAYLKRLVEWMPDESQYLFALAEELKPQDMLQLLEARLKDRPLKVDWHLLYQGYMKVFNPKVNLAVEYAASIKDAADQADGQFLLASLQEDQEQAMKLFVQAANAEPPSCHAQHRLAKWALSQGKYQEALDWCVKALKVMPHHAQFQAARKEALMGLKQYQVLLNELQREYTEAGLLEDPVMLLEYLRFLTYTDQKFGAETMLSQFIRKIEKADPTQTQRIRAHFQKVIHVAAQDPFAVLTLVSLHEEMADFCSCLMKGDLEDALEELSDESDFQRLQELGLLYLMADQHEKVEMAGRQWKAFLETLREQSNEGKQLADKLDHEEKLDVVWVKKLGIERGLKRIVLRVVAHRYPEMAKELLPLARLLDVDRDEYSLVLQFMDKKMQKDAMDDSQ